MIAIKNNNDHDCKKKMVPTMIEHSSGRQQTRITLFMFEWGQQRGLVFTSSKN